MLERVEYFLTKSGFTQECIDRTNGKGHHQEKVPIFFLLKKKIPAEYDNDAIETIHDCAVNAGLMKSKDPGK